MIRWTIPVAVPLILLAACSSSPPVVTVKPPPSHPERVPHRRSSGDIIVRTIFGTGQQAKAQALGDQWGWNYTTGECQTGTDFSIATAPTGPGACTQAALAQDNPAYNLDAVPAAPLLKVIAASSGC